MALVIRASSFFVKKYLKVADWGVQYMEAAVTSGKRKFNFGQIDYVLLAEDNTLSFQVGQEVFSIKTKPGKQKHQMAIDLLIKSVTASQPRVGGFPVLPAVVQP